MSVRILTEDICVRKLFSKGVSIEVNGMSKTLDLSTAYSRIGNGSLGCVDFLVSQSKYIVTKYPSISHYRST